MSEKNNKTEQNTEPEAEMLKNLDLLLNYEIIGNEDQWSISEEIESIDNDEDSTSENTSDELNNGIESESRGDK